MEKSDNISQKVILPSLSWHPKVNPTPGHISIVGSGRVESSSHFSEDYLTKMKEAGFNIAVGGSSADPLEFCKSLINGMKTGMKIFARYGFSDLSIDFNSSKPTATQKEELKKVLPDAQIWKESYDHWDRLTNYLSSPLMETINGQRVDVRESLGGFMIVDEPNASQFWGGTRYAHLIWDKLNGKLPNGSSPFIYVNLYSLLFSGVKNGKPTFSASNKSKYSGNLNNAAGYIDGYRAIESYDDYVKMIYRKFNLPVLSFDAYPFYYVSSSAAKGCMIGFFSTLVYYQQLKKNYQIDFWSHIFCFRVTTEGNSKETSGEVSLGKIRFSVFVSLLFGATGLVYWTYAQGNGLIDDKYVQSENPVDTEGKPTKTYEVVKEVNRQVKAIEHIFLSTKIAMTAVTQAPPHVGQVGEIPGLLEAYSEFGVFKEVNPQGKGVVLAHLYNSDYNYIAVVNMDVENMQQVYYTPHDGKYATLIYYNGFSLTEITFRSRTKYTLMEGGINIFRYPR